jgi:hypothetical protein
MSTTPRIHRASLVCLAAVAVMAAACSSTDTTADAIGDPVANQAAEASWLFSQTSDSGRIEFTNGVPTRLVMVAVDLHTIMFSDRPDRLTDVVDTSWFTDRWDKMFADSPPNAVLVEHHPDGETDSLVVVLSRPVLDTATQTLSYDIEVLADEDHPDSVRGLIGESHDETPTKFRAASLFIDATMYSGVGPLPAND